MIRQYKATDKEQVLELIRLNTPGYFAPSEEEDLSLYLDEDSEHYLVVEENGKIIGAGGYNFVVGEGLARLSWDVIHPRVQGTGIGSNLTRFRIAEIRKHSSVKEIQVRTSQHVHKFYEKMGFSLLQKVEGFWAPGFDLYDMRMLLSRSLKKQ